MVPNTRYAVDPSLISRKKSENNQTVERQTKPNQHECSLYRPIWIYINLENKDF